MKRGIQDWRDSGLEGYRTVGKKKTKDKQEGCGTGEMQDRRGIRGGAQYSWDAGLEGCNTGGIQERRVRNDAIQEGCSTGGIGTCGI